MIILTGVQGIEVDDGAGSDDLEEEVEDIADLAFLDQLSAQKDEAAQEVEPDVDDTRDSDDETDAPLADARRDYDYPDPDDPDYDKYMYASQCLFYLLCMLSIYLLSHPY